MSYEAINYEKYQYNENFIVAKNYDGSRLAKQLGDFSEQLVMTLLGRLARYNVASVDHEGVDLIAIDANNRRYAISVKSSQMSEVNYPENETYVFKKEDQLKLCKFASEFDMIPAVAIVLIPRDLAYIDLYIMTLDAMKKLADLSLFNEVKGCKAIRYVKNGIQINNYSLGTSMKQTKYGDTNSYLSYLQTNELIEHIRLDLLNRTNFCDGIRNVSCDEMGDVQCIQELLRQDSITKSKDGNLSRQLGDFAEYLVMMLLGQQKGHRVARVDHVGADLVATDRSKKKYAISVKSLNGSNISLNREHLMKLENFAQKFNLIPAIAFVFIEGFEMHILISELSNWLYLSLESKSGVTAGWDNKVIKENYEKDIRLNNWKELLKCLNVNATSKNLKNPYAFKGVEHVVWSFSDKFNPDVKWRAE